MLERVSNKSALIANQIRESFCYLDKGTLEALYLTYIFIIKTTQIIQEHSLGKDLDTKLKDFKYSMKAILTSPVADLAHILSISIPTDQRCKELFLKALFDHQGDFSPPILTLLAYSGAYRLNNLLSFFSIDKTEMIPGLKELSAGGYNPYHYLFLGLEVLSDSDRALYSHLVLETLSLFSNHYITITDADNSVLTLAIEFGMLTDQYIHHIFGAHLLSKPDASASTLFSMADKAALRDYCLKVPSIASDVNHLVEACTALRASKGRSLYYTALVCIKDNISLSAFSTQQLCHLVKDVIFYINTTPAGEISNYMVDLMLSSLEHLKNRENPIRITLSNEEITKFLQVIFEISSNKTCIPIALEAICSGRLRGELHSLLPLYTSNSCLTKIINEYLENTEKEIRPLAIPAKLALFGDLNYNEFTPTTVVGYFDNIPAYYEGYRILYSAQETSLLVTHKKALLSSAACPSASAFTPFSRTHEHMAIYGRTATPTEYHSLYESSSIARL